MTKKLIRGDSPYIAQTFNSTHYYLWGYPLPPSGGRLSGMEVFYDGVSGYYCSSGTWISIGEPISGNNAGVVVFQESATASVPAFTLDPGVSAGFYGYIDTAAGTGGVSYYIVPTGNAPSGATLLATGIANNSSIVQVWLPMRLVSVAGHVFTSSSAHAARAVTFDNSFKQIDGNPDNVQDAIDWLDFKNLTPQEISWQNIYGLTECPIVTEVPYEPRHPDFQYITVVGSTPTVPQNTGGGPTPTTTASHGQRYDRIWWWKPRWFDWVRSWTVGGGTHEGPGPHGGGIDEVGNPFAGGAGTTNNITVITAPGGQQYFDYTWDFANQTATFGTFPVPVNGSLLAATSATYEIALRNANTSPPTYTYWRINKNTNIPGSVSTMHELLVPATEADHDAKTRYNGAVNYWYRTSLEDDTGSVVVEVSGARPGSGSPYIPPAGTGTVTTTTASMNGATIAAVVESYIPGGLITDYLKLNGQFSGIPILNTTSYDKYGIEIELWDDKTGDHGVYFYSDSPPFYGSKNDRQETHCAFNCVIPFGGEPDARYISEDVNGYQYFTSATSAFDMSLGKNVRTWQASASSVANGFLESTEKIYWRNPRTLEWVLLTRDKDYSIGENTVVELEFPMAGYFMFNYKIRSMDFTGVKRDIRADNGLRVFSYVFLYTDKNTLFGGNSVPWNTSVGRWDGSRWVVGTTMPIGVNLNTHIYDFFMGVSLR